MVPPFGRFPGPGLPPTVPPSGAPFTISTGTTIHPTAAFSGDAYGVSGVPDRPKKVTILRRLTLGKIYFIKSHFAVIFQASVPNWLREEIKKTVITAPSVEHPKEETTFTDDGIDKSYVKGDEADSKSIDSSRSAEDEEDEEVSFFTIKVSFCKMSPFIYFIFLFECPLFTLYLTDIFDM